MKQKEMKKHKDSFDSKASKEILFIKREMKKAAELGQDYIGYGLVLSEDDRKQLIKDGYEIEDVNAPVVKHKIWFDLDSYKNKKEKQ